jgi:hypothetical protein
MNPPDTIAIHVIFDPAKVSADEVEDAIRANAVAVRAALDDSLWPLMNRCRTGFQIQVGGLPPGTQIQIFGAP